MRAFDIATAQPWLIRADALRTIIEIASRSNVITAEVVEKIAARKESLQRDALATRRGHWLENARYTEVRPNGVAVVNVTGPIIRYADLFTEVSGGLALQNLAMDFRAALESAEVKSIILNVDSPGGEVNGIHEFGEQIFAARGRGKRLTTYSGGSLASAAYWLGSACDEIVIDRTALLPAIGIVIGVRDPSDQAVKVIEITSKQSPKKRLDPTTDEGLSELHRYADELADVFVEVVARNRGVTVEKVLSDYGQGSCLVGADAVAHGVADRLGSLEELVEELGRPRSVAAAVPMKNANKKGVSLMAKKPPTTTEKKQLQAGPGACSECESCTEFIGTGETCERESCGHPNASHAEATTVDASSDMDVRAELESLRKLVAASDSRARNAEIAQLTTKANAKVDEWVRDGRLTGNAVAEVRTVYVAASTGGTVTAEAIEKMVAALPKISTTRIAASTSSAMNDATEIPSADEWRAAERGSNGAKAKIDTHVKALVAADGSKSYAAHYKAARAAAFAAK